MKNVRLTERVSMALQMSAFNALNRGYFVVPDPNIEDSLFPAFSGTPSGFLNNYYASGGGASPAAGGAFGQGPGNRSVQLGGKLIFEGEYCAACRSLKSGLPSPGIATSCQRTHRSDGA